MLRENTSSNSLTLLKKKYYQLDTQNLENKKRSLGQIFTSREIAGFMVSLSSKSKFSAVLEPCTGQGVFIDALNKENFKNITGIEIDSAVIPEKMKHQIINDDFLSYNFNKKFDLIIGNPPYVRWKHLPEKIKTSLAKSPHWKRRINALSDLLQTFIFKNVDLLEEEGELIFITPYFWFQSLHAKKLRNFLVENGYFEEIIHFGEHKLFKDASTNNIIFKFIKSNSKQKKTQKIKIIEMNGKKNTITQNLEQVKYILPQLGEHSKVVFKNAEGYLINQFKMDSVWNTYSPDLKKEFEKIEKKSVKLSDVCEIKVGMVSGLDPAFKIPTGLFQKLTIKEKNQLIKVIKGKDIDRFFTLKYTMYLTVDDIPNELILRERYPNLFSHLKKFKTKLKKRYDYNGTINWWQWAFPRNKEFFILNKTQPKIFVPSKDRKPKSRFCYTENECFGTQDTVCLVKKKNSGKEDLKYILCLLNSELLNKWYKWKGIRRGDVRQYSYEPMSKIPIKLINWEKPKEVKIYHELLEISNTIIKEKKYIKYVEKINRLVKELYNS